MKDAHGWSTRIAACQCGMEGAWSCVLNSASLACGRGRAIALIARFGSQLTPMIVAHGRAAGPSDRRFFDRDDDRHARRPRIKHVFVIVLENED